MSSALSCRGRRPGLISGLDSCPSDSVHAIDASAYAPAAPEQRALDEIERLIEEARRRPVRWCRRRRRHGGSGGGSFADQLVNSALRYRGQVPLVDSLLGEMGIDGRSLGGLTRALTGDEATAAAVEAMPQEAGPAAREPAAKVEAKPVRPAPADTVD
jgi:hypothetical protein